jgi:Tfp pilus assembly protein PilV
MIATTTANSVSRQRGSFILEALISLLLFAVALMGLMALAAQGLNQVGQSKARNDASYMVGELLSEMWVSATVDLGTALAPGPWPTRLRAAIPGATGAVYMSTCDCADTGAGACAGPATGTVAIANPQPVTVCVSWTDAKDASNPRRYQASSMITRN